MPGTRSKKSDDDISPKYHELNQRLEEVIAKLEDPNVDVDDAVKYYEEAAGLIERMENCLEDAQNEVHEITKRFGGE